MLEDFSSNSKGKRTYAYTILFLELKTLNVLFFCQNLQFCWSQTSHTNSSDEILKPSSGMGFRIPSMECLVRELYRELHDIAMAD
ncbi:hypothetical protein Tco_1383072 [Tanacetum coccineum]